MKVISIVIVFIAYCLFIVYVPFVPIVFTLLMMFSLPVLYNPYMYVLSLQLRTYS